MSGNEFVSDSAHAFEPPVALASLSGQSDAKWAKTGAEYAGIAFLGGIAIDEATRRAAREMVARDRTEFLPGDPVSFIDAQLAELADVAIRPGFNVRTTTLDPLVEVADVCREHGAILELNAHCRQDEICAVGGGESLLQDTRRLCEQVRSASERGVAVSVKVRSEVPGVDLPTLAKQLEAAGATIVHVDAMDSEPEIAKISEATNVIVIANNGVRDRETVFEYLEYGADAVSVGRPSDDLRVLSRVHAATVEWFEASAERTQGPQPGKNSKDTPGSNIDEQE